MTETSPPSVPRVGAVTVSYGSDEVLAGLLRTIPDAAGEPIAVVITDNLPSEGDSEGLARSVGGTYVALPENPGYGGAVNAGVKMLPDSVEWFLIVNPDVELGPGSIATMRERGESDPTIGAVGPLIRDPDGTVYPSARAVPSLRTGVGHAMLGPVWPSNPWTRAYRKDADTALVPRDAGWLSGSCQLVRRSAFEAIGGFDEGYFMYFEDVDLGARLGAAGFRNVYEPAAEVMHSGAHSTGRESERMVHAHHASARRFLSRKYPGPLLWPIRTALSLGLQVRGAWMLRKTRRSSAASS